ncbi:hypothetical protein GCM10009540_59320 [Streptomyces turgidiscabies]
MAHRDHGDEQEREQAQDLPYRYASVPGRGRENGCHNRRGSPYRTNTGLRTHGHRPTRRATARGPSPVPDAFVDLKVA